MVLRIADLVVEDVVAATGEGTEGADVSPGAVANGGVGLLRGVPLVRNLLFRITGSSAGCSAHCSTSEASKSSDSEVSGVHLRGDGSGKEGHLRASGHRRTNPGCTGR